MSAPGTPTSRDDFADARADLFAVIAERIAAGLNPPTGLRDHRTEDRFHALVWVERAEDVMAWARSLGQPVNEYGRKPIDEPQVIEYPRDISPTARVRLARVNLADNRYVEFQHTEQITPGGDPS